MTDTTNNPSLARWRLVLGRYAEQKLAGSLSREQARMERALDFLYSREYSQRGVREEGAGGSLDPSQLSVPKWINEVHKLFPSDTVEILTKHALERYELTELVTNPKILDQLEPNMDLLKAVLSFKGRMKPAVLEQARRVIATVVEQLRRQLENEVRNALAGTINRFRRSQLKVAQNLDWRTTVRRNLKNWDPERQKLFVDEVRFFSRVKRRVPWTVVLCVDQSASMVSSVIHSAVMAGIFAGLPAVDVKIVVFDTSVVDLSQYVDDPVEVLMSVQLGGGTNIGQALAYCEKLVQVPRRTILVLISDFEEGASPRVLLGTCRRMAESGVRMLGLASLDEGADAWYDRQMAARLAVHGMEITALTPKHLAEWVTRVVR